MSSNDIRSAVRKIPFEPFRIQVSDGSAYDVIHPELVMIGVSSVIIGVSPAGESKPFYERTETVSIRHIVKLLPIQPKEPAQAK